MSPMAMDMPPRVAKEKRGMGLDIVNSRIRNVGGKIRIKYAPGFFTEFAMSFPKNSENKNVIG